MNVLRYEDLPVNVRESFEKAKSENDAKEAFHRNRSGLFTASEIHKLLTPKIQVAQNETSRNYIFEKAFEKATGQTAKPETFAKSLEWGNMYEAEAVSSYIAHTGNEVECTGDNQHFLKHDYLPVGAYPDGRLVIGKNPLECKCPANGGEHFKNLHCGQSLERFKLLRFNYFIQVQVQIWLSGCEFGDFFTYRPNVDERFSRYYLRVPRCEKTITSIKEAIEKASEQLEDILKSI